MNTFIKITITLGIVCRIQLATFAQMNPAFFPDFQAYPSNPIIKYGDGFADATWNDPCVIKQNGQYIMYITAAIGISGTTPVKVYRQISTDGYNWTLSPTTPVLEPASSTYYAGGTETPSVVFKDSTYHMYLTCYPAGNVSADFVIAHATSSNGINWTMDTVPILQSDGSLTIYGTLVAEPGAIVYHDSIYVFFTGAGTVSGTPIQCIGLMKSKDGTLFNSPQQAVTLPLDVYPLSSNYWGLSTPSALAINDSIYLFTDVAQTINGKWTQVALHQFKTDGVSGNWYHDAEPIHTMQDFNWTNGTLLSEIRSITPLLDDNGLLRIWYAGNRVADVTGTDTTYHGSADSTGMFHIDPNYWGIGTSKYQFPALTDNVPELSSVNSHVQLYPNPANNFICIKSPVDLKGSTIKVNDIMGRVIKSITNINGTFLKLELNEMNTGIYFINIETDKKQWTGKFIISK